MHDEGIPNTPSGALKVHYVHPCIAFGGPRPDAQDLTSRALARSWPSHVCALADEPELGGFELIAAVPEQRPPSPPLEVPAAP